MGVVALGLLQEPCFPLPCQVLSLLLPSLLLLLSSQSPISSAHSKVSSVGNETLETLRGAFGMMIQRWKELHWRDET